MALIMASRTYSAPDIINREHELRLIQERLDGLNSGAAVTHPVLFFHGVQMVGKSTLLRKAYRLARSYGMPAVLLDFDREQLKLTTGMDNRYDGEARRVWLAHDLMAGLIKSADAPAARPIQPEWDTPDEAVAKCLEYIGWLQRFLQKPVALLFDTLEELEYENLHWLQERLLSNLLDTRQVFVAFAGWAYEDHREPDKLHPRFIWPVSRCVSAQRLKAFGLEDSSKQVSNLNSRLPGWLDTERLLDVTGGLPGLNEQAVHQPTESEHRLLESMVEVIFDRVARQQARDLRDELLVLAAFRQFDLRLLGQVMQTLWPEKHPQVDRPASRRLLNRLQATTLVEQYPDGYGYVVPHDIRRVLDTYLRRHNPQQHFQTHELAFRWFQGEVEKGDRMFVADELYHLAALWRDVAESQGKLAMPDGLPNGQNRLDQLKAVLANGLEKLEGHRRKDVLPGKLRTVLQGAEFGWLLDEKEIEALSVEVGGAP
jgi:hypothetical protein